MTTKNALIATVVVLFSLPALGQKKIDSLKALLPGKTGVERVNILFEITREYMMVSNLDLSKLYGHEGYEIAKKLNDTLLILKSGKIFAMALRRSGAVDSSLQLYIKMLPMARKKHAPRLNYFLNSMGVTYFMKAEYDKALRFYFESLDLSHTSSEIAIVSNNIGLLYYKLTAFDKALVYYKRSLQLKNKVKNGFNLDQLLNNIALIYAQKDMADSAKLYVDSAMHACGGVNCSARMKIMAEFTEGTIKFKAGNLKSAASIFLKCYDLAKADNDFRYQFDNIYCLSEIYLKLDKAGLAIHYLNEAEDLIKNGSSFNLELMKTFERLSEAYAAKNDFKKTAFYQSKYIALKDSIYSRDITNNLMKVEADYLERENEMKLASQEQTLLLNKEMIKRQRLFNIFTGSMALMLTALGVVLFRSNRQKKMINRILDEKVKERTRQLEESRNALIRSGEERDMLIAHTSQEMKSCLSSILGLCSVGMRDISDPQARQYIDKVNVISGQLVSALKNLHQA